MNKKWILVIILILLVVAIIGYFVPSFLQVTRANTDTNHSVSSEDMTRVKNLFPKNGIDIGTLAVVEVSTDERGEIHVWSKQFYNGLPIFWGNIGYHFDVTGKIRDRSIIDGSKEIFTSGERIGNLNISTEPKISMYAAAKTARDKIKSNYFFSAELGFLDLNAGTSYPTSNFVLVWIIKPKGAEQYPYAVIDANSGKLLRYDDGIRT